jgi:hypothetical protein
MSGSGFFSPSCSTRPLSHSDATDGDRDPLHWAEIKIAMDQKQELKVWTFVDD